MDEIARLILETSPKVRPMLHRIHKVMADLGCKTYVKTIYIGYEVEGEIVAASYPRARSVEVALALPEDHPSELLKDGTHLTWRTMPVLVEIESTSEVGRLMPLLEEAVRRVSEGEHQVELPNDRFIGRSRRNTGLGIH